jgi:hypothetical protein
MFSSMFGVEIRSLLRPMKLTLSVERLGCKALGNKVNLFHDYARGN